jgi:hypothetical protein
MRRPFVTLTCALITTLAPVALFAQNPPAQQPPTQQPPAQQPPAEQQPAAPKEIRTSFTGESGILLFQIKPDQTAAFEDLASRVKDALAKSEDPVRKQQLAGWTMYKAAEPMGANALYVLHLDPVVKGAEYDLFVLLVEGLGKDYATPENQEMVKKFVDVFAAGPSRLNLTALGK